MIHNWLKYWIFYGDMGRGKIPIKHIILGLFNGLFGSNPIFNNKRRSILKQYNKNNLKPPAFIHIPKTGGSTLRELRNHLMYLPASHCVVRKNYNDKYVPVGLTAKPHKTFNGFFVFTTIRHPITFFVSYYYHALGTTSVGPTNVNHYDYANAQKGFYYLMQKIMNREDKWPGRKFLYLQMFDGENNCIVDWINRQERLSEDIAELSGIYGINSFNERINSKRLRNSKVTDYFNYYDDKLLQEVVNVYSREIELFGYNTNNEIFTDRIKLKPFEKDKIKYDYVNDILFFKDNELKRKAIL